MSLVIGLLLNLVPATLLLCYSSDGRVGRRGFWGKRTVLMMRLNIGDRCDEDKGLVWWVVAFALRT